MPLPAPDLERLFEFENQLESGFVTLLSNAGINAFSSRGTDTLQSPYVSLYCTAGAVLQNHQYIRQGSPSLAFYDWFEGTLTTEIVTNRISDSEEIPISHTVMLGKVRKALALPWVKYGWPADSCLQLPDIRQSDTADTWEDEDSLDHTIINWYINFQIKPAAWPVVIE